MTQADCFKAYDIRGKVPEQLNETLAEAIGRAMVQVLSARTIVVGYDVRLESPSLSAALRRGITEAGADVIDIGLCGTEEVYFQTAHTKADGGVMVTASHNPKGHNGMKFVRSQARPISGDSGLFDIRDLALSPTSPMPPEKIGAVFKRHDKQAYLDHLLSYIQVNQLKPLRILADPGNGGAGMILDLIKDRLPFDFIQQNNKPDGNFPNGVPNPLLPENRQKTSEAVRRHHADLGIAWDGDFDRCFFYDGDGAFIEGYYLVGLLAEELLAAHPDSRIIHDPRLVWNTIDQVTAASGIPVQSKTGHAFIKERMRQENALYGGEMSAHHYFRDFNFCDSGMIPWLLVAQLMSRTGRSLKDLVRDRMAAYPCSGEINFPAHQAAFILQQIEEDYRPNAVAVDHTDGLSMSFAQWRFNLRASNTEGLLRLNIESRGSAALVEDRLKELSDKILSYHTTFSTS